MTRCSSARIKERDAGLENRIIGRAGLLPKLGYNYNKGRNSSKATYLNEPRQKSDAMTAITAVTVRP